MEKNDNSSVSWAVSVGRHTRCVICGGKLRLPCPVCRNMTEPQGPCLIYYNKILGHKHRHCYSYQYNALGR